MDITWLGGACFRLRADDTVVLTDPFPGAAELRADQRTATVVTVSSRDPEHSAWRGVEGDPRVFSAPGEYEYRGIAVRGVMTPLPSETPQERRSVAFSIEIGGVTICHLGKVAVPPTTAQVDELAPVDVLLAPVGGSAISMDQVLQTMQDLSPRIVIPMELNRPGDDSAPAMGMEAFFKRMGLDELDPQPRLSVTANNLPADLRVVALAPQARPA